METENEVKIKQIVGSIRRLYRAVYLDSSKMSRQFGLTGSQSGVLRLLFKNGPISSAELSRNLYVTPSNITGIIDRLEKKKLVERVRRENDRRVVLIMLTESGKELSRELPDPIEKKLILGLGDLEKEEVAQISRTMDQLLGLIDAAQVPDAPFELSDNGNRKSNAA